MICASGDRCKYYEHKVRNRKKLYYLYAHATSVSVSGLVDQLTNVERIANTPIPKSCAFSSRHSDLVFDLPGFTLDGIHLKQCVTLYLFSLPFTLVKELGWATLPVITVVSFTFMGIEGIAEQIEMPFGKRVCYRYMAHKLMGSV